MKISGATGNTAAPVGTPKQVADSTAAYDDLGVCGVLIRGFDPLNDVTKFGKELIPRIRALVTEREEDAANTGRAV